MRDIVVAIDLETTGLDASTSKIIEIGAVKFRDHDILETYSTLVDPESPIPPKVTAITNIRQDDLAGAPRLVEVLPALTRFVGESPVLGHNIEFDLRFLQRAGVLKGNTAIDTYELASVLLPAAPRYNLNSLVQQLNLTVEGERHRALADAEATVYVYMKLWDKALHDLPLDLLREIVTLAQDLPWLARPMFVAALQAREGETSTPSGKPRRYDTIFRAPSGDQSPLEPKGSIEPIDTAAAAALLQPGSKIAQTLPNFEVRPQQLEMLTAVSGAINRAEHLLVETSPQTGRTFAYLIPAIQWAVRNNTRVVLATSADGLRQQLIEKDLPLLKQSLGIEFQATALNRRSRYLCPARLETSRRRLPTSVEELRVLAKVQVWLSEDPGQNGALNGHDDPGWINLRGPVETNAWIRLSAQDEECSPERCQAQMSGICPFYRAYHAAQGAHLVVVDHALLVSDTLKGASLGYEEQTNHVLPDYQCLIVDEAHEFEQSITYTLGFQIDATSIRRQLADLGTLKTGLLADVLASTRDVLPEQYFEQVKAFVSIIADASRKMHRHIDNLFQAFRAFLEATNNAPSGEFLAQIRLTAALHNKPAFGQVRAAWATLSQFTEAIAEAMGRLSRRLATLEGKFDIPHLADLLNSTGAASLHLETIHRQLNTFIAAPDANTIYWIEISPDADRFSLHAAPLNVGPFVRKYFWDTPKTVIMTSDSLRTSNTFDFIRERLHASAEDGPTDIGEVATTDPADYVNKVLLYLPTDMPEPTERNKYQQAVERGIIELAAALDGRLLVLFTSFMQLRQTAQSILPRLGLGHIPLFDQSDGTSLSALLEGFRETPNGVLLGGREFWEDVDLTGDEVAGLVIVRLPFAVPSEPIFASRGETYENSFSQYNVPDAILQFRRGMARLIRSRQGRGVVALFDRRVISKEYGQQFLDSLPPVTSRRGPLSDLQAAAKEWRTG